MSVEMKEPYFKSTAVHSFGWEPIKSGMRGNVHIQFHKDGELTTKGFFKGVQKAIFAGLEAAAKPGAFIHQNLREHFEWVRTDEIDVTIPDILVIPASVPNTIEAITACVDAQRIQPPKEALFQLL